MVNRDDAEAARVLMEIAQPLGAFDADHVQTMFKLRAIQVHPDRGGTVEAFVALDRAKHVLLKWLARTPDARPADLTAGLCEPCGGSGYIKRRAGFSSGLRQQCVRCKGTGDTNYDHEKAFE